MSTGAEAREEGVPLEEAEGLAGPRCQVFAWGNGYGVPIRDADSGAKIVPTDADLFEEAGLNTAAQLKLSLGYNLIQRRLRRHRDRPGIFLGHWQHARTGG